MTEPLRWGFLGTGNIARQFAEGLAGAEDSRAVAVGSRRADSASGFSRTHGIERAHASYEALLGDTGVEAVYLSLPNSMHHEWTLKALRAGKHVLCEKPLARTAAESEEMFDAAAKAGRLLVEAFMYRSHPLLHAVTERIDRGAIGQLLLIRASFCYCTTKIEGNIRFDRALAGGALMDVGCYCVDFARLFAGAEPTAIHAAAHKHETGVDDRVAGTISFANGVLASFNCGMTLHADNTASLCGSAGFIEIPVPWKPPARKARFLLKHSQRPLQDGSSQPMAPPVETFEVDAPKPLYALEADDFAASVRHNRPPTITRGESVGNMKILDEIRGQTGLEF